MENKKRRSIYNPVAQNKWKEKNREHARYLSCRSTARSFIRNKATEEDLEELLNLIKERMS